VHHDDLTAEVWDDPTRGRLAFTTLFSNDLTPTNTFTAGLADVPPGGWLGRHRHTPAELYYVVAGQGSLTLDGVEHPVRAGSAVCVPGDVEHGISNTGTEPLRFFYAFALAGFAEVQYRFSQPEQP
jgi:mannose-6-phosphate isomerase-like protein (cupin superfamily)